MCHKINYYGMVNIIPNEFTVCNLMWAEFTNQHKVSDGGLTTKVLNHSRETTVVYSQDDNPI